MDSNCFYVLKALEEFIGEVEMSFSLNLIRLNKLEMTFSIFDKPLIFHVREFF